MAKNNKFNPRWARMRVERDVNKALAGSDPVTGYRGPDPYEAIARGTVKQRDVDVALQKLGGRGSKRAQDVISRIKQGVTSTRGGTIAKAVSRGMLSAPAASEAFAMDAAEDILESYGDYPGATLRGKKPVRRART